MKYLFYTPGAERNPLRLIYNAAETKGKLYLIKKKLDFSFLRLFPFLIEMSGLFTKVCHIYFLIIFQKSTNKQK